MNLKKSAKLFSFGYLGVPDVAGYGLDVHKSHARRGIGNANEVPAGRALDLPAGELWLALKRSIAMRAIEFEFRLVHKLYP